ncbi:MAG: fluoride efflux transporter CrcB [Ruminococcus sp.]|jgi:CrcB protein|nr:fluoride efflux transporter CrcB [Ruminococcus sp.]
MIQMLYVGIGGFIGSCARFGINKVLSQEHFVPFGTLLSNVTAGLLIGIIIGTEREFFELPEKVKLMTVTGFLGGLSTFSAFSLETVNYIELGEYFKASANVLLNLLLCFAAVFLGFVIVKFLKTKI